MLAPAARDTASLHLETSTTLAQPGGKIFTRLKATGSP